MLRKDKTVALRKLRVLRRDGRAGGRYRRVERSWRSRRIAQYRKDGHTWLHFLEERWADVGRTRSPSESSTRRAAGDPAASFGHASAALGAARGGDQEATQKGSFVGPDKLTFDFNSAALTPAQVRDIERLVNERIVENAGVSWTEVPYADVRGRADIMQFFGDKYGETVRVVQIGGAPRAQRLLDGTLRRHAHRATGEIGFSAS